MGTRERRSGLFGHAKYSDTIIRNIPESVRKAVREDIAAIVDPLLANTRAIPGRKRSHRDLTNGEKAQPHQNEAQNYQKLREDIVAVIDPMMANNTLSTPTMKRPHLENGNNFNQQQNHNFATKNLNLKKIAAKIQDSHPTITLRSDEPRTLSDATFSLVKNALSVVKEKSAHQTRLSPFRTLSDQTMHLGETKNEDKDKTLQDSFQYLEESPTADMELSLGECSSYPSYPPLETTFRQPVQCSSFSPIQEDYDNNFDVYNRFDEENFDVLAGEDLTPEQQPESSNGNVYPFSFF
uniref:Uncharacterized protein n=1 Tax=Meloidogyne enterolobii TaxID=390850 RepID=A0A6V7VJU9_MELEN|nr:unnamed protein product [Meloidogyne enterolobii]